MGSRNGSMPAAVLRATDDHRHTRVRQRVNDNIALGRKLLATAFISEVVRVAEHVVAAYQRGGKVLFFGNGGSAADAAHLAAEMCGRFLIDRPSLPAIALADNSATLTAIGNDYGFADIFARQVEGFGEAGDGAIGISTSGESENVIRAIKAATRKGLWTVGLTGASGGRLMQLADLCLCIPSSEVPRIQEAHALVGHILCEIVEASLFHAGS